VPRSPLTYGSSALSRKRGPDHCGRLPGAARYLTPGLADAVTLLVAPGHRAGVEGIVRTTRPAADTTRHDLHVVVHRAHPLGLRVRTDRAVLVVRHRLLNLLLTVAFGLVLWRFA